MRIVWTRRYLRELADIGDYIAERDPRAAARIVAYRVGESQIEVLFVQHGAREWPDERV